MRPWNGRPTITVAAMPNALQRRLAGGARLTVAILRDPSLAREVPRWARDSGQRRDPLAARQPWWNYKVREFVAARLRPSSRVFEFGGGASTLWLVDQGCDVHTVEHDIEWHRQLVERVRGRAEVDLIPPADSYDAYVNSISSQPDGTFDLVIVDGRERVRCGLAAMSKVKQGGMLLLDDSDRDCYRPLHESLAIWLGTHLRGLKPGDWEPSQTSVWIRPA